MNPSTEASIWRIASSLILVVLIAAIFTGCALFRWLFGTEPSIVAVVVEPDHLELRIDETLQLFVTAQYTDASQSEINWSELLVEIADESIVTLSGAGEVTAHAVGSTTVTITLESDRSVSTSIDITIQAHAAVIVVGESLESTESGGYAELSVVLSSRPESAVSMAVASTDPSEGVATPSSLSFSASDWDVVRTVIITGVDDDVDDGDQQFRVMLGPTESEDDEYDALDVAEIEITNIDDDTAGISVSSSGGVTTSEDGTQDSLSLVLDSQPLAEVSLQLTIPDDSEAIITPDLLLFTVSDWYQPHMVTISGVDDDLQDGDQVFTIIVHSASSGDAKYDGIDPADISANNIDDEPPQNTLAVTVASAQITTSSKLAVRVWDPATFSIIAAAPNAALPDGDSISAILEEANPDGSTNGTVSGFDQLTYPVLVQLDLAGDGYGNGDLGAILDVPVAGPTEIELTDADLAAAIEEPLQISGVTSLPDGAVMLGIWQVSGAPIADFDAARSYVDGGGTILPIGYVAHSVHIGDSILDGSGVTDQNSALPPGIYSLSLAIDALNDGFGNSGDFTLQLSDVYTGGTGTDVSAAIDSATQIPISSEGSQAAPFHLTGQLPHAGSAGVDGSYYVVEDVDPDHVFEVYIADLTGDVDLFVYGDPSFTSAIDSSSQSGLIDESVQIDPPGSSVYIKITDAASSGAFYELDANTLFLSEGTSTTPIDISAMLPYVGEVDTTSSYYAIDGLPFHGTIRVTASDLSDDIGLLVYDTDAFAAEDELAAGSHAGLADETVVVSITGKDLYIEVTGASTDRGAEFLLAIEIVETSEGSNADPLDVTGTIPHSGFVDNTFSYYVVSGLTPGSTYGVTLAELTDDVDLHVYGESSFEESDLLGYSNELNTTNETATIVSTGGSVYIRVSGFSGDGIAEYTLGITAIPEYSPEGSPAAPADVTGLLPYSGQVDTTASYYVVTGLVPLQPYTVSVTDMTEDLDGYVFYTSGFSGKADRSGGLDGTADEVMTVYPTASEIHIKIDGGWAASGSSFVLDVQ